MKSLPMVVTLALAAAFLVSVTFTPLISYYVLRGQKGFDEGGEVRSFFLFRYVDQGLAAVLPYYRAALQGSLRRPWLVLGVGYSVLALSCLLVPLLGDQFFPPAERNQLLVDIEAPSTDSLTSIRATVASRRRTDQTPRGGRQRGGFHRWHRPPLLLQRRTQGTGQLSGPDSH
jgi:multidrug efflux pump subunit AcrB